MYLFLESLNWFPCDIWVVSLFKNDVEDGIWFPITSLLGSNFMFLPMKWNENFKK